MAMNNNLGLSIRDYNEIWKTKNEVWSLLKNKSWEWSTGVHLPGNIKEALTPEASSAKQAKTRICN